MGSVIKADLLYGQKQETVDVCVINPVNSAFAQDILPAVNEPDPRELAVAVIDQARQEADALISSARSEAESIREKAYREGYDEGCNVIMQDKAFYAERYAQLEADLTDRVQESWDELETDVLMLALDIARKVVRREVEDNDNFVLTTIREGLRQLKERQEIKIWVNPEDYDLVLSHKEDIKGYCDGIRSLEIVENRRTDKGGCLIESSNGHLDARLDTQLKVIETALMEAVRDGNIADADQP